MSFEIKDTTYSFGSPKIYKEGEQLSIDFGLIPIDIFPCVLNNYSTGGFYLDRKPTLWNNIFIFIDDETKQITPFLRKEVINIDED